jgi:hypothetical protein
MPGLDEEVDRVQKPLIAPHYQNNFTAEKKAICIELSRCKSLLKMLDVSNSIVDRDLMNSDDFSDVEIIKPTSSASTASLVPLYKN